MPPVTPAPQTSVQSNKAKMLWTIGGVFIIALLVGIAYAVGGANILGNFFTDESTLEPTVNPVKGAVVVQSHNKLGDQKTASVILVNTAGEQKVLTEITNYTLGRFVPEPAIANGNVYFVGPNNTIAVFSIEKGLISTIPHNENSWDIHDLVVGDDTLVYLSMGPWKESDSVPSQPCVINSINLSTGVEVEILSIPVCSMAHGPNYSLGGISADASSATLFEESGEAGYAGIVEHSLDLATKKDTKVKTVISSPVCAEGMFYDEVECTQEVKNKNAEFDAFEEKYLLGGEWKTTCGDISISKNGGADEYYTLYIKAGGKDIRIDDAGFVGCYQ